MISLKRCAVLTAIVYELDAPASGLADVHSPAIRVDQAFNGTITTRWRVELVLHA